ncbi:DUF6701 domain-containing protein [Thalassotalea crassostreae]|uniref:DUF6701 domain-containing protein n=1 Tax=Thalassotalea crassostreae TaxID=1763536 RepID=UPI0008383EF1|nr:DUF6701 domain-containing protein [Thalassotalea crassostreae]
MTVLLCCLLCISSAVAEDSLLNGRVLINEIYEHQSDGFVELKINNNSDFNAYLYIEICSGNNASPCSSKQIFDDSSFTYPNIDVTGSVADFIDMKEGFVITLYDQFDNVVDRIISNSYSYIGMPSYSETSNISTKNGDKVIRRLPDGSKQIASGIDIDVDVISSNAEKKQTRGKSNNGNPDIARLLLTFSQQSLTCEPLDVTVQACIDSNDCSSFVAIDSNTGIQISADGKVFDVEIDSNGVGHAQIFHNQAETVQLSTPAYAYECSPSGCFTEFKKSILQLSPVTDTTNGFSVCGAPRNFVLQAKQSDENNQCLTLFANESEEVSFISSNSELLINGSPVSEQPLLLNFDEFGYANLQLQLDDSGIVDLQSSVLLSLPGAGDLSLLGASTLGFYPQQLAINANHSDGTAITTESPEIAAKEFNFNIDAMCANDVISKSYVASNDDLLFTLEHGDNVQYLGEFNLPETGATNKISDTSATLLNTKLAAGRYENKFATYTESGELKITVEDNYFGQKVTGSTVISKFIPEHFELSVEDSGSYASASCDSFSYIGKQFNGGGDIIYNMVPVLAITPYSAIHSGTKTITKNYSFQNTIGPFNITRQALNDTVFGSNGALPLEVQASLYSSNHTSTDINKPGVVYYHLSMADHFYYKRSNNSMVAPFLSDIVVQINGLSDADGVNWQACDPSDANCICSNTSCELDINPTPIIVSFGRAHVFDTFGPATQNLQQIIQIQSFNGSAFSTVTNDNCTSFLASDINLYEIDEFIFNTDAIVNNNVNVVTFNNGSVNHLQLPAPNKQGRVGVIYQSPSWFQFNWSGGANFDENPFGIATFGVFNPHHQRIINSREVEKN